MSLTLFVSKFFIYLLILFKISTYTSKGYISKNNYFSLLCSDGNLPRAYGLPKVHKPGFTFRIIISSIDSPTYELAQWLQKIISKNITKPYSHIENNFQLINKLNNKIIGNSFDLISLDVISLFTNVPIDLALDGLTNRWDQIKNDTKIPMIEFIQAVKLIFDSTFFTFNNKIYKQKFGTPMGSPLSPVIANIVMDDLEKKALNGLMFDIPLYYRYVDDIAMAVPCQNTKTVLDTFNSIHPRLQFTMEIGGKKLNFLDITMTLNKDNILEFDL